MVKEYLEIGKIVGTHGLKGELRVEPWCDSPDFLCDFKYLYINEGKSKIVIDNSKVHKNIVIMSINGVDSIDKAELLRNTILYINRKDAKIDDDAYFIQDIIGMEVYDIDNPTLIYGNITDVFKTGANDVYQITSNGKNYLIPVIESVVINVDVKLGKMGIRPIEGIFENED